jgi:broad specificity phosphatase PhoE
VSESPGGEGWPGSLVVVRHGSTDWSVSGRHTGRTDRPLTADGKEQARALAERLSGFEPALVFTSPLLRARDTCWLAGYGAQARLEPDLVEWDYGAYEGLTFDEIRAADPTWNLFDDGCPGGESPSDVGSRADGFLQLLRDDAALDGRFVMVFAHGHLLRVLAARWLTLPASKARMFEFDVAGIGVLGHKRGEPVMERWNC